MSNLTVRQGFLPTTFSEAKDFASELANSNLVPKNYAGKPLDILVAIQWGTEIGLAPMQALQNISVINGKPSVYGDAAMALVQAHPACEGVEEFFEGEGTPNPVAVCIAHRRGRKPVTARFSVEDAKRAGLWNKQGPWTSYPKRMLQMRARGFALRDAFPDALKGLITTEEAADYPSDAKPAEIKDIPRNPLDAIAPAKLIEETYEVLEAESQPDADTPEPEAEATVVVEEAVIVQDAATVDVEEAASPVVAQETGSEWTLFVPGKESIPISTMAEWLVEYNKLADQVTQAGKVAPRKRMTKLRELREANEPTVKRLDTMIRVVLTQAYQTRLGYLGTKMKEEEGKVDNVKEDHGLQRQT
jgi:hypothetical protein